MCRRRLETPTAKPPTSVIIPPLALWSVNVSVALVSISTGVSIWVLLGTTLASLIFAPSAVRIIIIWVVVGVSYTLPVLLDLVHHWLVVLHGQLNSANCSKTLAAPCAILFNGALWRTLPKSVYVWMAAAVQTDHRPAWCRISSRICVTEGLVRLHMFACQHWTCFETCFFRPCTPQTHEPLWDTARAGLYYRKIIVVARCRPTVIQYWDLPSLQLPLELQWVLQTIPLSLSTGSWFL